MQAQERWGLAGQGPSPTQDNLAGAEGRTLLLALAVRVVLADLGETRWLSLAEAQTEELSVGMAWAVAGRPWPGKLEQGAAQAEAGDAGPPARPVLPGALRRAAAPDLQPASPPCLAPYPSPSSSVEREISGLWRVLVLSVPSLVRGHRDRLFPLVSSLLLPARIPVSAHVWRHVTLPRVLLAHLTGGALRPEVGRHLPRVAQ